MLLTLPLSLLCVMTAASAAEPAFPVASNSPLVLQQMLPTLTASERTRFDAGRSLFNQVWIASPSTDAAVDGLGPTYNQSSCAACHAHNGRGAPPANERERLRGALVRLSV
ncbi:MAG TPA: di-heme oxidoredictase family protein, partial [Candidatus Acidoferrum sp.]|nr:di-heme oxidoredictase family protein [Candidatus Acidoferrum sp.]